MNKFLIVVVLAGLFGCSKKSDNNAGPGLSGKYALYKEVDTTFSPTDVLVETLTGDTVYLNYGTSDLEIIPSPISDYKAADYLADTLNFISNNTGVETGVGFSSPSSFTYSLGTGMFNNGNNHNDGTHSLTSTMSQINPTTLKILIVAKTNGVVGDSNASFYKKL